MLIECLTHFPYNNKGLKNKGNKTILTLELFTAVASWSPMIQAGCPPFLQTVNMFYSMIHWASLLTSANNLKWLYSVRTEFSKLTEHKAHPAFWSRFVCRRPNHHVFYFEGFDDDLCRMCFLGNWLNMMWHYFLRNGSRLSYISQVSCRFKNGFRNWL